MRTPNSKYAMMVLFTILTVIFLSSGNLLADKGGQIIDVEVKGMFCPICAYKAEKKLKEIGGIESVHVDLKAGKATVTTTQPRLHCFIC